MKESPIQQKQSAPSDHESAAPEGEGKSMSPPTFQLMASNGAESPPVQRKTSSGGLSPDLVNGFANSTGHDLSDVKVHRNSDKPAQVGALAYAQGNDIHLGAGQDQHLAHEAAHIVQQREGRVQPTTEVNGKPVNDSPGLESEADSMGAKAMQMKTAAGKQPTQLKAAQGPIQRIPRSPGATPFDGKIIPWSTPIRESASPTSNILADVPKDHVVRVLGGDAWLHCTTVLNGRNYDGYISHEQIKREVSVTNTTDTGNSYNSQLTMYNRTFAITKEVNFVDGGGFAAGAYVRLRNRTINAIGTYLDRKYKVRIASPDGSAQPGNGDYPITVAVTHNASAPYSVNLLGGAHGSSAMSTTGGNIYELGQATEASIPDITLAHEGSHMVLGASDEYANASIPGRVLTNDHSLMANYYAQGVAQAEIKARHFGFLVTQVGAMFPGRTISIVR